MTKLKKSMDGYSVQIDHPTKPGYSLVIGWVVKRIQPADYDQPLDVEWWEVKLFPHYSGDVFTIKQDDGRWLPHDEYGQTHAMKAGFKKRSEAVEALVNFYNKNRR